MFILIFVAFLMLMSACGGHSFKADQRMEGFRNETLRVYIRIHLFDEETGKKMTNDINDSQMLDYGRKRASCLLEGYIFTAIDDDEKKRSAFKEIPLAVKRGKIIYRNCNDEYCEAFIDFNIKALKLK